jgi:hypothetical protein
MCKKNKIINFAKVIIYPDKSNLFSYLVHTKNSLSK